MENPIRLEGGQVYENGLSDYDTAAIDTRGDGEHIHRVTVRNAGGVVSWELAGTDSSWTPLVGATWSYLGLRLLVFRKTGGAGAADDVLTLTATGGTFDQPTWATYFWEGVEYVGLYGSGDEAPSDSYSIDLTGVASGAGLLACYSVFRGIPSTSLLDPRSGWTEPASDEEYTQDGHGGVGHYRTTEDTASEVTGTIDTDDDVCGRVLEFAEVVVAEPETPVDTAAQTFVTSYPHLRM